MLYPMFNGDSSFNGTLVGMLRSSSSALTIEFWMKDTKDSSIDDLTSVILIN